MKRLLSFALAAIMVVCTFASCSTLEKDDRGAIVTMYLADEIYDYDPMLAYTDAAAAKVFSLIYEGLTRLDAKGNWEKAMMDSYKEVEPDSEEDGYRIQINLRENKWSDGRTVQANDFIYAWKRILEPTNACEAASLLYDIKNAREIKMGDATVDDLGVYAIETYVLEIEFASKEVDLDAFFRNCASVALVPLQRDKVESSDKWAKRASSMVTNGPFAVRGITIGQEMRLERSAYYYRDTESNQALDKYVIPYRLVIQFGYGNKEKQLEHYEAGDIFYMGELPLAARADYEKEAVIRDGAATHTYFFNTENELFEKPEVRKALSMAIDRQALAELVVYADAATGLIPSTVLDAGGKGKFREKGGTLIENTANISEAQSLLKEAGVTKGSFAITVRDTEVDLAIAEYVADVWKDLGFTVKVKSLSPEKEPSTEANQSDTYKDMFQEAYKAGDFDVIALDYQMLSSDAFSALAPFAAVFSGNGVDMDSADYDVIPHVTGYDSEDYSALIEEAYAAGSDSSAKTEKLHEAETMLLDDMPVMPLLFLKDAYICNDKVLSGIKDTYWGRDFKRMKMRNYMEYKESMEAESQGE